MVQHSQSSATPGVPSAGWLAAYRRLAPFWRKLWPGTIEGLEKLPDDGPFLLVANHSGLGIAECVTFGDVWMCSGDDVRPLAAMALPGLFRVPLMGDALRGFGAVEATREGAAWARSQGVPLLLFPGGDRESMRPAWRARDVDFAGRKGWIRLAREHRLTIVPLAITGSHLTVPNLGRARWAAWLNGAKLLGLKRSPMPLLSLVAAAATLGATRRRSLGFRIPAAVVAFWSVALVPWVPSRIRFHLMDPVNVDGRSDDEIYQEVTRAIASCLDAAPVRESPIGGTDTTRRVVDDVRTA